MAEQETAILDTLRRIEKSVERREPDFWNAPISDALNTTVDYRGRRYLYIRAGQDLSLITTLGSTNTFHLPPEQWYRINFRPGTHLFTSGAGTTSIIVAWCATDDRIEYQPPYQTNTATPITSVSSSATSVQLLAANPARKAAYFYNDSNQILYLAYGTANASTTAYTVQIQANGFFEMPTKPIYTNAIQGIWASANGAVRITELS